MAARTASIPTEPTESAPRHNTAQARYAQLIPDREPYLMRGRDAARLTIPSLLPPEGSNGTTTLFQPWQSIGAKGVNNLASKLLLILFPPGGTFFRLTVDDFTLSRLLGKATDAGESAQDVRAEIEEAFGKVERAVVMRLEERGARMQLFEGIKHLLVTGNCLIQMLPDERLKLHKLDRYVVKRDQQGTVTEMVVMESVAKVTLPPDIQALLEEAPHNNTTGTNPSGAVVDIYTWIRRTEKTWTVHQEVHQKVIPGSEGTFPLDKSPWMPQRLIAVDGEDYGRGFVEEVMGDLQSLDSLRQSVVEGAAISARMIPLVDEGGVTSKKDLVEARNGQPISGKASDVTFLQVEKFYDLRVAQDAAQEIKRDLQQAFLLLAGSQRDAERVTAEEIRMIAQELETTLGGVYSVLTQELQMPITSRTLHQMERKKQLPKLPTEVVSIQIVTGIAGLGRNSDFSKLKLLVQDVGTLFGPEVVAEYLSPGSFLKRSATALALDIEGMVRSDEEVQQQRAEAQKMALAQASIAPAAKMASDQMSAATPPTQ